MQCPPTDHHLHRTNELVKRLHDHIVELQDRLRSVKHDSAQWEHDQQKSVDKDSEIRSLRHKLEYKDALIALKDEMLQISSREHIRFMDLYLERSSEMETLRETNDTLVKKILNLNPAIYNTAPLRLSKENNNLQPSTQCPDIPPTPAPSAACRYRVQQPTKSRCSAAV